MSVWHIVAGSKGNAIHLFAMFGALMIENFTHYFLDRTSIVDV